MWYLYFKFFTRSSIVEKSLEFKFYDYPFDSVKVILFVEILVGSINADVIINFLFIYKMFKEYNIL